MANKIPRVPVREQDPKVRVTNFEEVCYGYDLDEARLEASRCLGCKKPRCVEHCPVSLQIPQFIAQLRDGNLAEAARIIAQDSSLPSVCGRVCPQETQCEGSCILGVKGESVAIGKTRALRGRLEHRAWRGGDRPGPVQRAQGSRCRQRSGRSGLRGRSGQNGLRGEDFRGAA